MKDCNQCGKCCINYPYGLGCATDADLARLEAAGRDDVLAWIPKTVPDYWISPITGNEADRCPWLRKMPNQQKYKCLIYDVRPDVCRIYPVDIEQMLKDKCEMLEELYESAKL